jgi:hypothetical protein
MHPNETEKALTLLTDRLERLEKQNSRLVRIALAMGAVLLLVVTLGAVPGQPDTQEIVSTKNLQVVDENGDVRVSLSVAEGEPGLILYDENGKTRASIGLGLEDGSPGFALLDENGKGGVALCFFFGEPALILSDKDNMYRGGLSLAGGDPTLDLVDKDGNYRAWLGLDDGEPVLGMYDADGNVLFKKP